MKKILSRQFNYLLILILICFALPSYSEYFHTNGDAQKGIIGQSLPATWRPFSENSPWNTPIPKGVKQHVFSDKIVTSIQSKASHIRLINKYNYPIWVINSELMPTYKVKSRKIFDLWDQNRDNWSDIAIPIDPSMWQEPTSDGHIVIIDPVKKISWEMSRFKWYQNELGQLVPKATTFNIWDLTDKGYAEPKGKRWQLRGGRGSGFPLIAGVIRPEELESGAIRHALVFTYPENRRSEEGKDIFISPPAARSDGQFIGSQYPIEGMRFQLDPSLTDADFERWGLNREGKIIAKALQTYGMYLGDNGGAMALAVQMLAPSKKENRMIWDKLFPEFYKNIKKIPTNKLRVIDSGLIIEK